MSKPVEAVKMEIQSATCDSKFVEHQMNIGLPNVERRFNSNIQSEPNKAVQFTDSKLDDSFNDESFTPNANSTQIEDE